MVFLIKAKRVYDSKIVTLPLERREILDLEFIEGVFVSDLDRNNLELSKENRLTLINFKGDYYELLEDISLNYLKNKLRQEYLKR